MPPRRVSLVAVVLVAASVLGAHACARGPAGSASPPVIVGHPIRVDASRRLLAWNAGDSPYAHIARLAWTALETRFPVQDNGLPTWMASSRFDPDSLEGVNWPHNPASLYAMLTDGAVLWYQFSGDQAAVDLARRGLDWSIDHGTTPADWDWARVPYASANAGDTEYRGADDEWCDFCGRGDGLGVIEPDKVGELGFAYLQMFEMTADARYRDAAVACADALAGHVREGDARRSPWPFRVYAQTNVVREEYSSNVLGAVALFDELARLGVGDGDAYARARATAVDWLMRVPLSDDAWSGYFEDIEIQSDPSANPNQYSALRTARWLLAHRDVDPRWHDHVAHLLAWAAQVFGGDTATERGTQWGATVMSEQGADMAKMGSHTARFAATLALWSEATGDEAARDRAFRSLNWATYVCREDGIVKVGEDTNEGWWFSDGYGDYVRHFLVAMAAVPQWAPARENHVLRSTSVVSHVEYGPAPGRVAWATFDADATETLRLVGWPASVTAGGRALLERDDLDGEGFVAEPLGGGGVVVRVRHVGAGEVVVTAGAATAPADRANAADAPSVAVDGEGAHGCGVARGGVVGRD